MIANNLRYNIPVDSQPSRKAKNKNSSIALTLKRRRMFATMMDTELDEAPITPTTLSGLVMMGEPPPWHLTSVPSFSMSAWTKVRDCSRAWVSREHVSRIRAPRVIFGKSSWSLLIRSNAKSMASRRWIPFSFFSSPQAFPLWPRAWTGNRPPREMSPSMRMEFRCVWPGPLGRAANVWRERLRKARKNNPKWIVLLPTMIKIWGILTSSVFTPFSLFIRTVLLIICQ